MGIDKLAWRGLSLAALSVLSAAELAIGIPASARPHIPSQLSEGRQFDESDLTLGIEAFHRGEYVRSQSLFAAALDLTAPDSQEQAAALFWLGRVNFQQGDYAAAIEAFTQARQRYQRLNAPGSLSLVTAHLSTVYLRQGDMPRAEALARSALRLAEALPESELVMAAEAEARHALALVYSAQGDLLAALTEYESALPLRQVAVSNWPIVARQQPFELARTLNNLGGIYFQLGEPDRAQALYQEALEIAEALGDAAGQARRLRNLGLVYRQLGELARAEQVYQQAIGQLATVGDRASLASTYNSLGILQEQRGDYAQAGESYRQGLELARAVGNRRLEARLLDNQAGVDYRLANYAQAIAGYEQALAIQRAIATPLDEASTLTNLGGAYEALGLDLEALAAFQAALQLAETSESLRLQAPILSAIGLVYHRLDQLDGALETYQRGLEMARTLPDPTLESQLLDQLGGLYGDRGETALAQSSYQQALDLANAIGDAAAVGKSLNGLGLLALERGEYDQALLHFQGALGVFEGRDRTAQSIVLANLADLYARQEQPEVAIIFYKRAVNLREAIRADLQTLPTAFQQSYIGSVAPVYRQLADLLLQQNRVLEAQQVMDLLKVQELEDYFHTVRSPAAVGVTELPAEMAMQESYDGLMDQAIQLGQALRQLQLTPANERTLDQQEAIVLIRRQQATILEAFHAWLEQPDVQANLSRLRQNTQGESLELRQLTALQDNLASLDQDAVLLYPLVLEDRLELVLVTPHSPPIRRTVPVVRSQLNRTIAVLRSKLGDRTSNPLPEAQQLYRWLIAPIADDLAAAGAKTLIYAPDDQLRYVPLAAVHDGERWLIEDFRINNITATSLADLTTLPSTGTPALLAAAYAEGNHQVEVRDRTFAFKGLPYAGIEVDTLKQLIPETTPLLNENFTRDSVFLMNDYSVVHLATHAAFLVGQPEDSFILFGDGDYATLREVETWQLSNVDLVVLSACETGLGGLGDGREILGLGYQVQQTGARAVMASLWPVSDGGTQALMVQFYQALQTLGMTKAEALRQAQLALISGELAVDADSAERLGLVPRNSDFFSEARQAPGQRLSHPYYWAPFILIGNGL
ncbi:MAG: CHAT domain-containing protein [Cyanobacteria bacterium J06626_23]